MVFSPAVAITACPSWRAALRRATRRGPTRHARRYGSSSGAIATIVLPKWQSDLPLLAVLFRPLVYCLGHACQTQRPIKLGWHKSRRTISARRGGVNWKNGKMQGEIRYLERRLTRCR